MQIFPRAFRDVGVIDVPKPKRPSFGGLQRYDLVLNGIKEKKKIIEKISEVTR